MERQKRVTHIVIFENYQEGYSYQENVLSQKHKELGYDVSIIASQSYRDNNYVIHHRPYGEYVNEYGIKVSVLQNTSHNPHLSRFFDKCIGLYEKICEISPDIIFLHNFSGKDVRYIVRYMKEHPSTKLFVDCHSDYYNKPIKFRNPLKTFMRKLDCNKVARYGKLLLPFAEKFWGTIPWRVQYLQEVYKIPQEKLGLLIMGADERHIICRNREEITERIHKEYGIPDDAFLIATGGKLDKRKQQHLLMEAVKQLQDKNVWLIIFGEPTLEMRPVFDSYKGYNNIVQPGWLRSDRAYDVFIASQLAFFPGTHSVLWEQAVACSTPIVTRHWTGMEHINVCGNALLLDEVNIDSIKATIISLNRTVIYEKMLKAAKEAAPLFYMEHIAKKAIGEE